MLRNRQCRRAGADRFSIEDGRAFEARSSRRDQRIARGPIDARHCEQTYPVGANMDLKPEAVVLDLMRPGVVRPAACSAFVGKHGSMKLAGASGNRTRGLRERHNIMAQI